MRRARSKSWLLYAGGFVGPFAGNIVITMLPELSTSLNVSVAASATTTTWYMVPFCAALMLTAFRGLQIADALRVRLGYGLFVIGSAACLVTGPWFGDLALGVMLLGRATQGIGNALTVPVILAALKRSVPAERLGTALGIFAAMQAAGQAFGPLIGGLAASIDYRWAFVLLGSLSAVLLLVLPPGVEPVPPERRPSPRLLLNRRLAAAAVAAFCVQFGMASIALLTALIATDRFGLTPSQRGMLVACMGLAGLLSGAFSGRLVDRLGVRKLACAAFALLALSILTLGVGLHLSYLVLAAVLGGISGTAARVTTNQRALESTPANTTGAMSVTLAIQFLGPAVAPVLVYAYEFEVLLASVIPALLAVFGGLLGSLRRPSSA